jgi:hypothetical protein
LIATLAGEKERKKERKKCKMKKNDPQPIESVADTRAESIDKDRDPLVPVPWTDRHPMHHPNHPINAPGNHSTMANQPMTMTNQPMTMTNSPAESSDPNPGKRHPSESTLKDGQVTKS